MTAECIKPMAVSLFLHKAPIPVGRNVMTVEVGF